jgi:hypothetical protein
MVEQGTIWLLACLRRVISYFTLGRIGWSWTLDSLQTYQVRDKSIAEGGRGVVIPGCEPCKKRINTEAQLLQHLADDVLPVILRKAFAIASET